MGVTITNYNIFDGAVTLQNVYINIRDIMTTKDIEIGFDNESNQDIQKTLYKLQFNINYIFNGKTINTNFISIQSETPYTENIWELAYIELKSHLDSENLTYSDNF